MNYQFECPDWNLPIVSEMEKLEWYAFERWLQAARSTNFRMPFWNDALEATASKAATAAKCKAGLVDALAGASSEAELAKRTGADLKAMCKMAEVSPNGTKAKMASRIWKFIQENGGLPSSSSGAPPAPAAAAAAAAPPPPARAAPAQKKRKTTTPAASDRRGTLIVAPMGVIDNWERQIEEHVKPNTLRVVIWHGADRHARAAELSTADVVITSYATLLGELDAVMAAREGGRPPPQGHVLSIKWHRAVLDEAHVCRNRRTKSFQSICQIDATHRWCLTGTPLQNKADDVFGILAFLRCAPLGDWAIFNRAVSRPIRDGHDEGLARLRVQLKTLSLRRGKQVLGDELPPKTIKVQKVNLHGTTRDAYDTLYSSARSVVAAAFESGVAQKEYMTILELITRLRQSCCARSLVPRERLEQAEKVLKSLGDSGKGKAKALTADEVSSLFAKLKDVLGDGDDPNSQMANECAVCLMPQTNEEARILRACSHAFCSACLDTILATDPLARSQGKAKCPLCRSLFAKGDIVSAKELSKCCAAPLPKEDVLDQAMMTSSSQDSPPPKVATILDLLGEMPSDECAVIFSGFTKFLDVIETHLKSKWSYARIDGSKSAKDRATAQEALRNGSARVLLVSTRAGGVGLNLTRANHVIMADLWWNAAVDEQAWDRCHRLGQKRPVMVHRLIADDTLEERLLKLQEAKAALGAGAMRKLSPQEAAKARLEDLRKIFEVE